MRSRLVAVAATVALLAGLVLATDAEEGRATNHGLNVVLILTDDQSYSSVQKMPYMGSRTGWDRFTNAYINNAVCCPSRATILTGLWSHHHGVEVTGQAPNFDDSSTLATWLDAAGYRNGLFGKYHLGNVHEGEPRTYIPPGWHAWAGWHGMAKDEAYYNYTLNKNGTLVPYGSAPKEYSTDVLANKAVDFIRNSAHRPFFLYFAPRAPHNPWTAAPRHQGAYSSEPVQDAPNYDEADMSDKPDWWQGAPLTTKRNTDGARREEWATLLAVDEAVKRIVATLESERLMRKTVIIYMTDNGYAYGEHRHHGKECAYDECTKTPLMIKYRGYSRGSSWPQLVGNEDLAPTIADLAGTGPGAPVDGDSFAPFLRTGVAPEGWPNEVLLRSFNRTYDPPGTGMPPTYWGIRTPTHKYIETVDTGEVELYDLTADPFELQSVHDHQTQAGTRAELAQRLLELRTREPR